MKNIAIIILGDFSRDARSINMADTLLSKGYNVEIVNVANNQDSHIENTYYIKIPKRGLLRYLIFMIKTNKLLRSLKPDIIIAADLFSLPASCYNLKSKIIYDSREIYSHLAALKQKPFKQFFWKIVESKYISNANHTFVTADSDLSFLKNIYGPIDISVIKNFPSKKLKPKKTNKLKKILGIDSDDIIFLYQGVIQKDRGIKNMIKLLKYFKTANVVLIGDGEYKNQIIKYGEDLKLSSKIFFINSVPYNELLDYTCGADIGFALIRPVTKSYINALPNKIFEYMLSDIPVLASNLPEMSNVINKYQLGYCTADDDIDSQINLVRKILNNNYNNISEISLKNFTWEKQEDYFMKVISVSYD